VVESLVSGDAPSTKAALAALRGLVADRANFLVVLERSDALTWLSLRNAHEVHIVAVDQLNTYDVLVSDDVVFTEKSLNDFLVFTKAQAAVIDTELEEAVDAAVEEVLVEEALEEAIEEAVVEAALEEVLEEESVTGVPAAADAVPAEVVAAEEDEEETK
jgi:large subunit ribosomal protein L4